MKKVLKYLTVLCLTVFVGVMFHSVDAKAARANGTTSIEVNEYTNYPAFSVHTDSDWSVDVSADFVTALNPTGTAGDAQIVLRIDSNPGKTSRSATIVVRDQYGAVSLSVTQRAKEVDYFKVLESPFKNGSVSVGREGGTYKFVCETDREFTITYDGKTPDQMIRSGCVLFQDLTFTTVSKKSNGKGGYIYEYRIIIGNNDTYNAIEHELEVKVKGGNISGGNYRSYTFRQSGTKKSTSHWYDGIVIGFRWLF